MRQPGLIVVVLLSACTYQRLAEVIDAGATVESLPDLRPPDARHDLTADADPSTDADAATFIEPCSVVAPTVCPVPAPSYADVAAIIASRCHSCHDGSGPQWGLTTYQHVADWQNTIHDDLLGCTMPPLDASVPITNAERLLILRWLRCGLPP